MKIDPIYLVVSVVVSILMAYGMGALCSSDHSWLMAIGIFIQMMVSLLIMFVKGSPQSRTNVNIKVLAVFFIVLFIISNLIFAFVQFETASYVVINGLMLVILVTVTHFLHKTDQ